MKFYEILQDLGLLRFAGAMMWVLQKVFALDRSMMICEPNEAVGRRLLSEVMATGNLGNYDDRYNRTENENVIARNVRKAKRCVHLVKDYPSEILWIPLWKIWHWCWRKYKGYR